MGERAGERGEENRKNEIKGKEIKGKERGKEKQTER